MTLAADIDLVDIGFWDRPPGERLADFARLRERGAPVYFPEPRVPFVRSGKGFYALVRHADVVAASRNAKVFSSEPAATSPEPPPWLSKVFGTPMVNMDDPAHARLRRIVFRAFTPKMLARIEDDIRATAARIVDDVLAEGAGAGDFVGRVAARLPIDVICSMMGIPEETRPYVLSRIDAMTEYSGVRGSLASPRTMRLLAGNLKAIVDLHRLVARLGEARREDPADDLVSALVNANPDGERLSVKELGSFFDLLLVAGNETTRNALAHGLKLFTDHPDQRDLLFSEYYDERIGTAIEELVRYVSPIIQFRRTVTTDHELNGHPLKAGDKVVLFYLAANRDPEVFTDPDAFDITRSPNPHVGFGGPGPHLCLGANLARMELRIMFRELFDRLPGLRACGEPEYLLSSFDNGITRLPFTWGSGSGTG
ncbi:cytochrome P450 [Actinomadura harenae]|uniref:Cytochrome P450 n=1 Tax=Actinomadura harenae TaxID=2483351 RepID=A0A3M2M3Y5_9ACTN|nr:cytochrome P450 [Actinomadura harenae]RMI43810.1 cytochrome P450 [Actinomadura harenae]